MAAAVWAMRKCRLFLTGRSFDLVTDHQPLLGVFKQSLAAIYNSRLCNMAAKVVHLDFNVIWKKGQDNHGPDALSRSPDDTPDPDEPELGGVDGVATVSAVIVDKPGDGEAQDRVSRILRRESNRDEGCRTLRAKLTRQSDWQRGDRFFSCRDRLAQMARQ